MTKNSCGIRNRIRSKGNRRSAVLVFQSMDHEKKYQKALSFGTVIATSEG
jgi:hypothetical protein